jgi:cysteine synthase A/cysteine synthase B
MAAGNYPDHELRVYSDVTQLIASSQNPTPLVRVNRLNTNKKLQLYLKLERYNPFGSIKDRIAYEMLKGLEVNGKTVVEPSSGNTGIALACVANTLGIPIEIAVPDKIPEAKKIILKLLGARLMEADDALCPLFPSEGARGLVNGIIKSPATKDKYVSPNQYENELNVKAHYQTTGPEIWKQTQGKIDYFFAGLGTCGTITGIGKYLKQQTPNVKVVGVEPASPEHKLPGMKRITGLAEEYIPKILDRSVIDDTIQVSDKDAYQTAIDLARKDGIPVGPTTGAILYAALNYTEADKGVAVVISPDDAFKYSSFYKNIVDSELDAKREFGSGDGI